MFAHPAPFFPLIYHLLSSAYLLLHPLPPSTSSVLSYILLLHTPTHFTFSFIFLLLLHPPVAFPLVSKQYYSSYNIRFYWSIVYTMRVYWLIYLEYLLGTIVLCPDDLMYNSRWDSASSLPSQIRIERFVAVAVSSAACEEAEAAAAAAMGGTERRMLCSGCCRRIRLACVCSWSSVRRRRAIDDVGVVGGCCCCWRSLRKLDWRRSGVAEAALLVGSTPRKQSWRCTGTAT